MQNPNPNQFQLMPPMPEGAPPPLLTGPEEETQQEPIATPVGKIKTGLLLTEQQRATLEDETITRLTELMNEMGRGPDGIVTEDSWMGIRKRYQDSYDNDYEWRKSMPGIFRLSNFSKGTNKRYVRRTAAKMRDELLGTSPFFAVLPARVSATGDSAQKAMQIERYIQQRIEQSNLTKGLRMGQRAALIRNEAVMKITFVSERKPFVDDAEVLVDQTGTPVVAPISQDYIYRDDDFFPSPEVEGLFLLEKDPSFSMQQGQYQFVKIEKLKQYHAGYRNVDARVVDFRSFLCPLKATSIHEADCVAHLMDIPADQLQQIYGNTDTFSIYTNSIPGEKVSGEQQAQEPKGETDDDRAGTIIRTLPVAEVYRYVDADQDGEAEEVFMVIDLQNKKLIFWDYLYRHMEKRPFEVIPGLEWVPNRWYGSGIFELMEDHQIYIDGQFNRINVADSKSETVRFRVRNSVRQWKDNAPVEYGNTNPYDAEPGFDSKNPPLFQVNLAEPSEMGQQLMADMEQAGDLLFGSISAQDASASNLNQSKTATGILNLERVGDTLVKDTLVDHAEAIKAIMQQAVTVLLENLDPIVSTYSQDNVLLTLNREEIRSIEKDIRLILTRSRSSEQLAANEKIEGYCIRYFNLPPPVQFYLREIYIKMLKSLEVADPDKLLPEVTPEQVAAYNQQQSMLAAQQQQKEQQK